MPVIVAPPIGALVGGNFAPLSFAPAGGSSCGAAPNFGAADKAGGAPAVPLAAAVGNETAGAFAPGSSIRGGLSQLTTSLGGATGGLLVSVTYAP
jgi:hypothetical protein